MQKTSSDLQEIEKNPDTSLPKMHNKRSDEYRKKQRQLLPGILMVIAGASLWGISGSVSKLLMDHTGISPLWMTNVKMLAGSAIFFLCAAASTPGALKDALHTLGHPKELGHIVVISLAAYLMLNTSYFACVDITNAATATILQSLGVPLTLAVVCLREHRHPSSRELLGFALALAGTYLLATGGNPTTLVMPVAGLLLGLLTAAGQACESLLPGKYVERWGSLIVNGIGFLVSGLALFPFVRPWELNAAVIFAPFDWFLLAFSILVGTFAAGALYMAGLSRIGPTRTSLLSTTEQLAAAISAMLLQGLNFSLAEIAGFVLVTVMVLITA